MRALARRLDIFFSASKQRLVRHGELIPLELLP